jgi:outer membrane murein-binding lipoprotein Lpp
MKFDVENELVDFNLERMGHKGKENLIKVAELLGILDGDSWGDYIEHGYIDLTAIAKECSISRSSLYQNPHIKRYITGKAEVLKMQGLLLQLPYQSPEKTQSNAKATVIYTASEKEIKEKNAEIKRLQSQVAELSADKDRLKEELKATKAALEREGTRDHYLAKFSKHLR